jgi:riboflavin synthase
MFTGIVETKGVLSRRARKGADARLVVHGKLGGEPLALGESIAVDGVCLTVAAIADGGFEADASSETLAKTTLGDIPEGAAVNLERALAVGDRLGGHIVAGHVDGVGAVVSVKDVGAAVEMSFEAPAELAKYVAPKGSIAVNGVSLTVNRVDGAKFDVMLVPHTLEKTSLRGLSAGSKVNLEADVLARYVARLLEAPKDVKGDEHWLELLKRSGYV